MAAMKIARFEEGDTPFSVDDSLKYPTLDWLAYQKGFFGGLLKYYTRASE